MRVLWIFVGYCALSCLTLPFIGRVWLGELPVLAFIQLPKIALAAWLRTHVVMEGIKLLGYSQGSFSPDYILARPYALALIYLIPGAVIGIISLRRFRLSEGRRIFVTLAFFVAAAVDYVFVLMFAEGRLLSLY